MSKKKDKDGEIFESVFDNSKRIRVSYENELEFNKLSRALRQYNMFSYKMFIFNLMSKLRAGQLVGYKLEDGTYRCDLEASKMFEFVYGKTYFTYRIEEGNKIVLISMEPKDFLTAGHKVQLESYKGIPITGPKARFKVDLYLSMNNK